MGRSLVAVLLTCFACRIVNAAESSLFGVPESLQIRIEGPRTYHFNWTFTRPRERPKEGPSSITVHVDTGDRTKTYTVEVSESFRLVSLSEADKDFVVDLKGVFDWLDGAKYVTTFRTLDEHQTSTPLTQVVLKQKIPGRYEIYCDSSERDVLQKYVVENCVTECSSTELDSTDSHVFFVPVQSNFSVGLRASYGYPHQSRDPHGLGPPCDTNLKGIPGKVENVTRAEHMEDKLYIEWEAPEGSDNPLYEVSITSEAETTPGISFLTNSTALHVFAPILLGPAFLASMRALYLDVHGRRCYGPFTEFSIPKYYPPVPSGIEILERKPNFVRFFIMTSKPEAVKSFKISIISPSTMKSFYLNSQTGTFRDLKPYTRVLFDVQQCYVQWESPIEVCGDPLRAEVMSNVGKPSQVKVHPLRHSNGRTYIDWDAPEETNGPLAGYKVFVEGENEWGFVVPYVKTLGPDVHSYPYDQKQIMNPHRYAVTAFTVDLNHGLDIYEELIWHTPDAIIYMRMIGAGLLAAIVLLGIIIYIKLTCFDTPTHFDVVAYQEELELNFTRVQREWRQVQVRQQAPRASSRRSVAVEPDRVAAAVVEPEELETPSPEYYYTTDESDDSVSFEGGQQETNRPRWHTARTS